MQEEIADWKDKVVLLDQEGVQHDRQGLQEELHQRAYENKTSWHQYLHSCMYMYAHIMQMYTSYVHVYS